MAYATWLTDLKRSRNYYESDYEVIEVTTQIYVNSS